MNEKFVAVSTVMASRIGLRGCFSKPRRDFSVTRGWLNSSTAGFVCMFVLD